MASEEGNTHYDSLHYVAGTTQLTPDPKNGQRIRGGFLEKHPKLYPLWIGVQAAKSLLGLTRGGTAPVEGNIVVTYRREGKSGAVIEKVLPARSDDWVTRTYDKD